MCRALFSHIVDCSGSQSTGYHAFSLGKIITGFRRFRFHGLIKVPVLSGKTSYAFGCLYFTGYRYIWIQCFHTNLDILNAYSSDLFTG